MVYEDASETEAARHRWREFQSTVVKGIAIEQFLLADGFPHPYPGQVDNPDIYNDYGRFV